ncbi:MAG: epoxide hydrolase family protein [Candidatus Limnocylindria bacterium]
MAPPSTAATTEGGGPIRPFRIEIPASDVADLRARLDAARWPDAEPDPEGTGWARGVPLAYLQQLAGYWGTEFDWPAQEAALNELPQFVTEVDGQRIHFIHAVSPEPDALPLLLLHSWPGSPIEFARVVGPLADPRHHGADPATAFHVVVPSLPGFGFSVPVREVGWSTGRMARAFAELMDRVGYERYGVHGGDIGAGVAGGLSSADPDAVVGVHVTSDLPTAVTFAGFSGDPAANEGLSPDQKARVEELKRASSDDEGYLRLQATRPQTVGYGLTDSPVAQLAWIVEKFQSWTDASAALPEEAVDRDQLLANVSVYWFTRSGASAAHALYESMHAQEWSQPGPAPMGFAVFGADPIVRILMDPTGATAHWSEFERGGHFPAMEQPELLLGDLRAFFATLRLSPA